MVAAVFEVGDGGGDGEENQNGDKGKGGMSATNEIWNAIYKAQRIMPSGKDSNRPCPKTQQDSCPRGYELKPCPNNQSKDWECRQCEANFFQPNENWHGDKCRLKKRCHAYADYGSTISDSVCTCPSGQHLLNEDHTLCVPNDECPRGKEPGKYGGCEDCLPKHMYSDTVGAEKTCKPLTNCEKQNRCTVGPSDGTRDNECGPVVKDLETCEALRPSSSLAPPVHVIISVVIGGVVLLLLLLLFFFLCRRRSLKRGRQGSRGRGEPLTNSEKDELRVALVKESDRDPVLCRKVLQTSRSFIEERIGRQSWTLAQELYRTSPKQAHFEEIVRKYKASQQKYAVNGYLQEWREWRGEGHDALADLFTCLEKVGRIDIVHEVCSCLQDEIDFHPGSEFGVDEEDEFALEKTSLNDDCRYVFMPCCYPKARSPSSSSSSSGKKKSKAAMTAMKKNNVSSTTSTATSKNGSAHNPNNRGGSSGRACQVTHAADEEVEAGTKLLAIASDDLEQEAESCGAGDVERSESLQKPSFYASGHPSPSAPELEHEDGLGALPGLDNVKFSRQYSQPVQATS